jgi:putative transposase
MLRVSRSGFYAWKDRPASARALRHLWLAGEITDVHRESGGIYGERRVAAELRHGRGIVVNRKTVTLLMRRLGLYGLPQKRLPKGAKVGKFAATDLVRREFTVTAPNRLWMTDITEHPTREGKVYCCVVLDAFSRKVVGWSIDTQQNTLLVTSALTMATHERNPSSDLVIHSDRGTRSSRPGRSAKRSVTPASHRRWEPSARHTTMRWSSRSGAACRSSYSTARDGKPASSSPQRSSTTSRTSTTTDAATAH